MLTLLSTGNVYIANTEDNIIRFVSASTGDISTIAGGGDYTGDGGAATSAVLNGNYGVAVDSSGRRTHYLLRTMLVVSLLLRIFLSY